VEKSKSTSESEIHYESWHIFSVFFLIWEYPYKMTLQCDSLPIVNGRYLKNPPFKQWLTFTLDSLWVGYCHYLIFLDSNKFYLKTGDIY
ncbi:hypothetical protein ACJX0J_012170, partial [Zea mays]